jgi:hypothetical protein
MISVSELRRILDYDPQTGIFTWKTRGRGVCAGKIAGYSRRDTGRNTAYVQININHRHYYAHRLAWLYVHGSWPARCLDHIDLDGTNNRITNLRLATVKQNAANSPARKNNRLGVKGVRKRIRGKFCYEARISLTGKSEVIGYFLTAEEAHAAYLSALKTHYGEFARGK